MKVQQGHKRPHPKQRNHEVLLTEGKIIKPVVQFMLPLIAGLFFQQLYSTTDSFIVGNFVGENSLAAIGASAQIINLLIGFFIGLTTGMGVVISQTFGAGDREGVKVAVNTSLWICIIGGIAVSVVGFALSPFLLDLMGAPSEVRTDALIYLRLYFAGSIANIIYNMGASVLRGVGDSRTPFITLAITSVTNIVLDIVFVLAFNMGVAGVGIATFIAQVISAVVVLFVLCRTRECYGIRLKLIRYNKAVFSKIVKLGIWTGLQPTIITISNMIVQGNINMFGNSAIAGFTLYWRIDNFLMIPVNALIMGATTYSGQNAGCGKIDRIKKGMYAMITMGAVYAFAVALIMFFFGGSLYHLFTPEQAVIEYGIQQSRIVVLGYVFLAVFQIMLGFIRGMGETLVPMLLSIANMCVLRVLYLLFIVPQSNNLNVVYFSYPSTWFTTILCVVLYYIIRRGKLYSRWEKNKAA